MEMTVTSRSGNYSILSGPGLLKDAGEIIRGRFSFTEIFVLSDDTVDALYGERVRDSLAKAGFTVCSAVFPHGEEQKNADTLLYVLNEMARQGVSRSGALLALGGGVTGDLGGLAAALYMRGIPLCSVPHHAARHGGCLCRRQDRRGHLLRKEPDRRVPCSLPCAAG